MLDFLKRRVEPTLHPIFGRLEWQRGRRSAGSWQGRLAFPPTGEEITLSIPGGRKGPEPAEPIFRTLCDDFGRLQPAITQLIENACTDAGAASEPVRLNGLYFFDTSLEAAEWKLVYSMGEHEIHVDGFAREAQSAFLLD